ncbi:hypothetical protein CDD80_3647 [Ophiocordyceps camponoti-rufipedis]|uniref:Reverse transcriptase Ty1/copia-type domain-containing protein n=1 Tax=Ophiocordyceps camponoti-rufipedis TaxID=2004952 RepID=A0A2C5YVT8_9HYPO|nr:hypothetical protein CDD80_3647 [Ophiocordyceps camponoti-rufipedis]
MTPSELLQSIQIIELKDLGELKWFLGIKIHRDRTLRKLWLSQESYIDKIAARFSHFIDGPCHTRHPKQPLSADKLVARTDDASEKEIKLYQRLIGSLLYVAIITRPDVAFATSRLSQHLRNPSPDHINRAFDLLAFLRSTKDLSIVFGGEETAITVMSDASFADNPDLKSSQGFMIKVFGGATS